MSYFLPAIIGTYGHALTFRRRYGEIGRRAPVTDPASDRAAAPEPPA